MPGEEVGSPALPPGTALWRRIPPRHFPAKPGRTFPNTDAFADGRDGQPMSVVIGDDLLAAGRSPSAVLAGHVGYALASITVGQVEALGLNVRRDPQPDEPAHAVVEGSKTHGIRKQMARGSSWVIPPPGLAAGGPSSGIAQ